MKCFLRHSFFVPASILIVFTAIIFFIRCYAHEPSEDEVLYQYVWEKDDPTNLWDENHVFKTKISSFDEILQTQIKHYYLVNGRVLIHGIEQAFTNHELCFSVVNTFVFILFVLLILKTVANSCKYPPMLTIVICLLLLFPYQASLWTSVNYGLNYLWPASMAVACILIWNKLDKSTIKSPWLIAVALLSFVFGWSHEGFSVGFSGGMILYYCFNYEKFKKQILWMAIPLWSGTAIMALAPGNLIRFFGTDSPGEGSIFLKLANGIDNLSHLPIFLCILAGAVLLVILDRKRNNLRSFIANNSKLTCIFIMSFLFSLVANTAPYSHTFTELLSLILILRYFTFRGWFDKRPVVIASYIITLPFMAQQVVLAQDTIAYAEYQRKMINEYQHSSDGYVMYDPPKMSVTSQPFIRTVDPTKGLGCHTVPILCGSISKPLTLLYEDEWDAIASPSRFYVPANKIAKNAPLYHSVGSGWIWVAPDSLFNGDKLVAEYWPVDFSHHAGILVKLKFALSPGNYSNTDTLAIDTIISRFGTSYRISYPAVRKIKDVRIVSKK